MIDDILKEEKEKSYRVDLPDFKSALREARVKNLKVFREKRELVKGVTLDIPEDDSKITDYHHRQISDLIMSESEVFKNAV